MEAKARYFASVEERETVDSFFEDYEIGLEPKKTNIPLVFLISVGSLAQFVSQKAEKVRGPGAR